MDTKILYMILLLFAGSGIFIAMMSLLKRKLFVDIWLIYVMTAFTTSSVIVPIYFQGILLLLSLLFFAGSTAYEMATILKLGRQKFVCMLFMMTLVVILYLQMYQVTIALFVLYVMYCLIHLLWDDTLPSIYCLVVAIYPGIFLSYFTLLACGEKGFYHVVFLYAIVEVNDTIAYLCGKFFGRRKFWPAISPHKTYEGVICGGLAALGVGLSMGFVIPEFPLWQQVILVFMIVVLSPCGDLVASKIKRLCDVKDFSNLIPTQGGVLDMLDSLIFTAPVFYYFVMITT
ncbi:phosphatidate cytidylyltransferase [Candidatus Uabimicrobium amorphum]|uniref:Phosphatidate cytidylyltransferase n=1 Tax=Uabimicrobium amorphum TaxID=2596890 RepID=A0A5S9IRQ7_UABAM|nr:phosphatidate cytidylyltransferase [Candidatus Uabimicrobium amorphum]BBM86386.1 phosphatidate cytidylyltransferase [Candidatus Uabimicrobium amorphum]